MIDRYRKLGRISSESLPADWLVKYSKKKKKKVKLRSSKKRNLTERTLNEWLIKKIKFFCLQNAKNIQKKKKKRRRREKKHNSPPISFFLSYFLEEKRKRQEKENFQRRDSELAVNKFPSRLTFVIMLPLKKADGIRDRIN